MTSTAKNAFANERKAHQDWKSWNLMSFPLCTCNKSEQSEEEDPLLPPLPLDLISSWRKVIDVLPSQYHRKVFVFNPCYLIHDRARTIFDDVSNPTCPDERFSTTVKFILYYTQIVDCIKIELIFTGIKIILLARNAQRCLKQHHDKAFWTEGMSVQWRLRTEE